TGRRAARSPDLCSTYLKTDAWPLPLPKLAHFSRGLLHPVGHIHFAVHRRRDGEVLVCLLAVATVAMHFGKTKVAVGDERTHAAGLGKRQGLAVVAFGVLIAACRGNVTGEAESVGLAGSSPEPAGERQRLFTAFGWSMPTIWTSTHRRRPA